jgi:hypothetical protein
MFTIPILSRMFGVRGELRNSCRMSQDGLRFIDFRTAERGDAIDFLSRLKGISKAEAFLDLLKMAEGAMPEPSAPARGPKAKTPTQPLLPGLEPEGGTAL